MDVATFMYSCHLFTLTLTVADGDYTSVSTDLTFRTDQTVMIMTMADNVVENPEIFTLSLTSTDSAVTVATESATVSIADQTSKYTY